MGWYLFQFIDKIYDIKLWKNVVQIQKYLSSYLHNIQVMFIQL